MKKYPQYSNMLTIGEQCLTTKCKQKIENDGKSFRNIREINGTNAQKDLVQAGPTTTTVKFLGLHMNS